MKLKINLNDYADLRLYIENAMQEYGATLHRVIISNDARLSILQKDGIDVNKHTVNGISVIAEPFLPKEEVQVVLAPDSTPGTL
jgi:hypothetical protein